MEFISNLYKLPTVGKIVSSEIQIHKYMQTFVELIMCALSGLGIQSNFSIKINKSNHFIQW